MCCRPKGESAHCQHEDCLALVPFSGNGRGHTTRRAAPYSGLEQQAAASHCTRGTYGYNTNHTPIEKARWA